MRTAIAAAASIILVVTIVFVHVYSLKLVPLLSFAIDGYPPAEYRIQHDCNFTSGELGAGISYLIANRSAEGDEGGKFTSMIEMLLDCGLDPETEYAWSENPLDSALLNQDVLLSRYLIVSGVRPSARFCKSMNAAGSITGVSGAILELIGKVCSDLSAEVPMVAIGVLLAVRAAWGTADAVMPNLNKTKSQAVIWKSRAEEFREES